MHLYNGKNSHSKVASFVDQYVSCSDDFQDIQADLLNLQLHRHAKTCKKMEKTLVDSISPCHLCVKQWY